MFTFSTEQSPSEKDVRMKTLPKLRKNVCKLVGSNTLYKEIVHISVIWTSRNAISVVANLISVFFNLNTKWMKM